MITYSCVQIHEIYHYIYNILIITDQDVRHAINIKKLYFYERTDIM